MKDIIDLIGIGEKNKITLFRKSTKVDLWWEDKDKWFCNLKEKRESQSRWVTEKDLDSYLSFIYKDFSVKTNFKNK